MFEAYLFGVVTGALFFPAVSLLIYWLRACRQGPDRHVLDDVEF